MKKFLLAFSAVLILSTATTFAQDFQYGTFLHDDLSMKSYNGDTSAHAVVLREYGNTWVSTNDHILVEHDYHVKIKIFDAKGFEAGNVSIPIYVDSETPEEVTDIVAKTTYREASGNIVTSELQAKNIFIVKQNKYWSEVKFAIPGLHDGCVIEYKYHLRSPRLPKFHNWDFQSEIPKMLSEYQVHIPGIYNYNISLRGNLELLKDKKYEAKLERECFSAGGLKCDCSNMIFAMANIPAFKEEEYMTSAKNFRSAVYFEMTDWTDLQTGTVNKISKEWKDVDRELRASDYFGHEVKRNFFKDVFAKILAGKTTDMEKAKAIYHHIQQNIKWNQFIGIYSDGIRKPYESHSGTCADINLCLTAALKAAGLNADPVILSTRQNGAVTKIFPVINEFNYVIAKVTIDGKDYLLDATDPLLAFGMLPMICLNDQGRVMSFDKPSYWIDLSNQKEASNELYELVLQDNGKLKGTLTRYSLGYKAFTRRKAIKKFSTVEEFTEDMDEKLPRVKIINAKIEQLDDIDEGLVEKYEVEIDAYDQLNSQRLAFNPFLLNHITVNPFKMNERSYPVDLGLPSNDVVTLNITLPQGYTVDYAPVNKGIALPNNGGKFITDFHTDGNKFSFSHMLQFNKPVYFASEYPYIKELYSQVINMQKADVVFKKN